MSLKDLLFGSTAIEVLQRQLDYFHIKEDSEVTILKDQVSLFKDLYMKERRRNNILVDRILESGTRVSGVAFADDIDEPVEGSKVSEEISVVNEILGQIGGINEEK